MSASEIDEYLSEVEEPKRSTLQALRRTILEIVPHAEQCISYGMPAFKIDGRAVAGFAAFKQHLSFLPHSGSVLPAVGGVIDGYVCTKGSLHFAPDVPLPRALVEQLLDVRMAQLGLPHRALPVQSHQPD
jgi:uncharacterized protein YdhG (YjbR/CyaY superfamily)